MKKTLKATHEFFYGGKTLKSGEEFEAVDPDANILVCLGKAVASEGPAPEPPPFKPAAAPKLETAALKPADAVDPTEASPTRRKRYMRRDMTAEEN